MDLLPDNYKDTLEYFRDILETLDGQRYEYETEHMDARDDYRHLPAEGLWTYSNGNDRLKKWIAENFPADIADFGASNIDEISNTILDVFEMIHDGHTMSAYTGPDFVVATFEVGEIESQIEVADVAKMADVSPEVATRWIKELGHDVQTDYFLTHQPCDVVLVASVDRDRVEEIITELFCDRAEEGGKA